MLTRRSLLFGSLTLAAPLRAFGTSPTRAVQAALRRQVQEKLDAWHAVGRFPGATVGVGLANGTTFGLAVGVSNRENKTPMKPTDRMLQGSVGKTYVAA